MHEQFPPAEVAPAEQTHTGLVALLLTISLGQREHVSILFVIVGIKLMLHVQSLVMVS